MRKTVSILSILATGLISYGASAQPIGAPPAAPPPMGAPPAAAAPEYAPAPTPTSTTFAAPASDKKMLLGADLAFQLPFGDLSDVTGMGFGALLRFEYKLMPQVNLTGRAGYIYSLSKDQGGVDLSVDNIPVWAGAKYFLTDTVYAGAELGLNMLKFKMGSLSDSETKLGLNVGAGVLLGDIDLRGQLEILSIGDAGETMALMINAGYNFMSF